MRTCFATCFMVACLACFSTAYATADLSTTEQVEQLSNQAAKHYQEGEFEQAAQAFLEAYELRQIPDLLFNIGRCYEQLREWDEAIEYMEQYVRSPDADDEIRDHAMDRLQELRAFQSAEDQARSEVEDMEDRARKLATALVEPVVVEEPSSATGLATLSGGGGLLVGGLILGMMANRNAGRIDDTSLHYEQRLSARSSARTQGMMADAFFVSGAAATVVGMYLLFLRGDAEPDHNPTSRTDALVPWLDGNGAGVGVFLDF